MNLVFAVYVIGISNAYRACNNSLFSIKKRKTFGSSVGGGAIMKCAALCLNRRGCRYFKVYPKCLLRHSLDSKTTIFDVAMFPKNLAGFQTPTMTTLEPSTILPTADTQTEKPHIAPSERTDPCDGYTRFDQGGETMCLRLHNKFGKFEVWNLANEQCIRENARLAVVRETKKLKTLKEFLKDELKGKSILSFLRGKLKFKIWIGLRGDKWLDGTKDTQSKGRGTEECAALGYKPPFRKKFYNCNKQFFFVCEKADGSHDERIEREDPCNGYTEVVQDGQTMCFQLHHHGGQHVDWNEARQRCQREGARLAVIKERNTIIAAKQIIDAEGQGVLGSVHRKLDWKIWVGLRGDAWIDGTMNFESRGQGDEECAALDFRPPFIRRFYDCNKHCFFLCEKVITKKGENPRS